MSCFFWAINQVKSCSPKFQHLLVNLSGPFNSLARATKAVYYHRVSLEVIMLRLWVVATETGQRHMAASSE